MEFSGGVAPIATFTDDFEILHTAGIFMGHVIHDERSNGRFRTSLNYYGFQALREALPPDVVLARLFGLNAPFLLQAVSVFSATYRILAYAEVDRESHGRSPFSVHTWGHDFITNASPGTDWKTFVPEHLQEFTIV